MLKFLKGEKPLTDAFVVSVFLVLISFGIVWTLKVTDVFSDFANLLIASFLITIPIRLFVWTAVLRCAKNTESGVFKAVAMLLVVADMLHKLFYWSVVAFSLAEHEQIAAKQDARFDQCRSEISTTYDQPMDNLYGEAKLVYGRGDPGYKVLTRSRTTSYHCVISASGIQLTESGYVKWFSYTKDLKFAGTYLVDEVELTPRFLKLQFGLPDNGDGIRVSNWYAFESDAGEVFTIYDYKSTTLWDPDSDLPTPEEFWSSDRIETLSVGGKEDTDHKAFVDWIENKHAAYLRRTRD
ncbi:MAG: hypothetical protein HKM98_01095 [Gammaproteobacteria bacterium]|nr:hypothetical protein [Gammaproteobacteria bacterium]